MKKALLIIAVGLVAVVILIRFRSVEKTTGPKNVDAKPERTAEIAPATNEKMLTPGVTPLAAKVPFLESDVMNALRSALATEDRAGFEQAYNALVEYFKAHPDQVDDYLSVLRSEKSEHVLRTFALAMADSEVGLLENDQIITAAIELAKDSSFEQRQHIMLNLMSKCPEMRDDVFQAILDLSRQDPNSQVKTSAVTVFADWMDRLPEKKEMLLAQVGEIFKTATDDDVRGFTYQVLALHKDNLSREMQLAISERLQTEPDSFSANLLASALSTAPDAIRKNALSHVETAFGVESDLEKKRNLLVQIVCLGKGDSLPFLQRNSVGDSLIAQDSRNYLALLTRNGVLDADMILQEKAIADASRQPSVHKD